MKILLPVESLAYRTCCLVGQADFAGACHLLPGSSTQEYKAAFDESVEWMRCYFNPAVQDPFLLEQSSTRAQNRQSVGKKPRGMRRFAARW